MPDARPPIPELVKREVRKRCGFGCVLCGSPVFEYDHMIEYSVVKEHRPENITLLCPMHHHEKTVRRLPTAKVQQANSVPANSTANSTGKHELYFSSPWNQFKFAIGSNEWHSKLTEGVLSPVLSVDGGPVLAVKLVDGAPLLRVSLRDADNRAVLKIRDNELTHALHKWDVTFSAQVLKIWDAARKIGLIVVFMEHSIRIVRGNFYANGYQFHVDYPTLRVGGLALADCYSEAALLAGVGAESDDKRRIVIDESARGPKHWV